jgi:tripartite-type tricarboxylate transporter receptor subunit TctC
VQAATPAPIVKKLEETLRRVIADPDVNAKLKAMAVNPGGGPSDAFRAMIDADIKTTADVVKAANLEFKE